MKRVLIIISLCLLSASLIFASGNSESTEDNSLNSVMEKGVFTLGLDDCFPPMGYRDADNNIVGYDIDLAKEVCKRMGVELKAQPISWDAKEQELNTHQIDCIWNGFTITDERLNSMCMTPAYLNNAQVVVVRDDSGIQSLADFEGKTVGVQVSSTGQAAVDDHQEFKDSLKEVVEFKDYLTALMDLQMGNIDAVVMDLIVANYNISDSEGTYRLLDENLGAEAYGVGFSKSSKALEQAVEAALSDMAKDGTMAEITTKWFGSDISVFGK